MSSNSNCSLERYVKCPYFVKFNSRGVRYIVCKGCINDCNVHLCFDNNAQMSDYAENFCNSYGCGKVVLLLYLLSKERTIYSNGFTSIYFLKINDNFQRHKLQFFTSKNTQNFCKLIIRSIIKKLKRIEVYLKCFDCLL